MGMNEAAAKLFHQASHNIKRAACVSDKGENADDPYNVRTLQCISTFLFLHYKCVNLRNVRDRAKGKKSFKIQNGCVCLCADGATGSYASSPFLSVPFCLFGSSSCSTILAFAEWMDSWAVVIWWILRHEHETHAIAERKKNCLYDVIMWPSVDEWLVCAPLRGGQHSFSCIAKIYYSLATINNNNRRRMSGGNSKRQRTQRRNSLFESDLEQRGCSRHTCVCLANLKMCV